MIKIDSMIAETAQKIYTDLCPREVVHAAETGTYPAALWDALSENGLPVAWAGEDNGGFGADYGDVFGAIWASAQAPSPVPFAETLVANWLLDRAGLPVVNGAAGFAIVPENGADTARPNPLSKGYLSIAFAEQVDHIVIFDEKSASIAMFDAHALECITPPHLSPDGEGHFDLAAAKPLISAPTNMPRRAAEAVILTIRAVQMAAAMESALNLTIEYVSAREQFGRALSKFQAIQHQLALAASEIAAATMAATQAAYSLAKHHQNPEKAWHEAVVAKVQIGHSTEQITVPLHQSHGAIGYTQEYDLHHYTRRLWAWRDALGNEHHWSAQLGEAAAALSPDQLWKGVTNGEWQDS